MYFNSFFIFIFIFFFLTKFFSSEPIFASEDGGLETIFTKGGFAAYTTAVSGMPEIRGEPLYGWNGEFFFCHSEFFGILRFFF